MPEYLPMNSREAVRSILGRGDKAIQMSLIEEYRTNNKRELLESDEDPGARPFNAHPRN